VIQPVPPPPQALLELPVSADELTLGYFSGAAGAGNATAEDVLANHKANALRCRDIEARYLKLREWALGLPKTATVTEGP